MVNGFATGKHCRLAYDTTSHQLVLSGGDYQYAEPAFPDPVLNGTQGMYLVWALDLSQGITTPWRLLFGLVGPGEIPGRPDTVGWVYDSIRRVYTMVPGYYGLTEPGIQMGPASAQLIWDAFNFDPSASQWRRATWPPPPPSMGPVDYGGDTGSSYAVYDEASDAIYRFRRMSANVVEILHRSTASWERVTLDAETNANRDQPALDPVGRCLYVISNARRSLLRYGLVSRGWDEVPLPTTWIGPDVPGEHETHMVFDPGNRVLLLPDQGNFGPTTTADMVGDTWRVRALHVYHVDTQQWEALAVPTTPPVCGSVLGFDEMNNVLFLAGRDPNGHHWLYRYGGGGVTPLPRPQPVATPPISSPTPAPSPAPVPSPSASLPGPNAWLLANPAMRTAYQPAVNSQQVAPDLGPRPIQVPSPINRTFSGLCGGLGLVFAFGGGHSSHPGNDVDVYDSAKNAWAVAYPPEYPVSGSPEARTICGAGSAVAVLTSLGRPYTQHSYGRMCFDRLRRRMILLLAGGTFAFDPVTRTMTRLGGGPDGDLASVGIGYHERLDRVLCFLGAPNSGWSRGVYTMTPEGTWSFAGGFEAVGDSAWNYTEKYAKYDPDRGVMVVWNGGALWDYRVETHAFLPITGFPGTGLPNFDYDRKNKKWVFVQTPQDTTPLAVWAWDTTTGIWTNLPQTSGPASRPFVHDERNAVVYDDLAGAFLFLKTVSQYGEVPGYDASGGTTETWRYQLA